MLLTSHDLDTVLRQFVNSGILANLSKNLSISSLNISFQLWADELCSRILEGKVSKQFSNAQWTSICTYAKYSTHSLSLNICLKLAFTALQTCIVCSFFFCVWGVLLLLLSSFLYHLTIIFLPITSCPLGRKTWVYTLCRINVYWSFQEGFKQNIFIDLNAVHSKLESLSSSLYISYRFERISDMSWINNRTSQFET